MPPTLRHRSSSRTHPSAPPPGCWPNHLTPGHSRLPSASFPNEGPSSSGSSSAQPQVTALRCSSGCSSRKLGACWPAGIHFCIQPPGDSQIPVWQSESLLPKACYDVWPQRPLPSAYQKYNSFLQTWSSQCIRTLVRKALSVYLIY